MVQCHFILRPFCSTVLYVKQLFLNVFFFLYMSDSVLDSSSALNCFSHYAWGSTYEHGPRQPATASSLWQSMETQCSARPVWGTVLCIISCVWHCIYQYLGKFCFLHDYRASHCTSFILWMELRILIWSSVVR